VRRDFGEDVLRFDQTRRGQSVDASRRESLAGGVARECPLGIGQSLELSRVDEIDLPLVLDVAAIGGYGGTHGRIVGLPCPQPE